MSAQVIFRRAAEAYAGRPGYHEWLQVMRAASEWASEFETQMADCRAASAPPAAEEPAARVSEPPLWKLAANAAEAALADPIESDPLTVVWQQMGVLKVDPTGMNREPHQLSRTHAHRPFPALGIDDPTGTDPAPYPPQLKPPCVSPASDKPACVSPEPHPGTQMLSEEGTW